MLRAMGWTCLLVCTAISEASAANPPQAVKPSSDVVLILHEVDTLAALMTDGVAEIGPEPKIIHASAGSDPGDAIVLFTMESWSGGNGIRQFLAAFAKNDTTGWSPDWPVHPYSLTALMEIGRDQRDWEFVAQDISIDSHDVITIQGLTWAPNDAHCCPSLHKSIKVQYSDYSLTYLGWNK